MVVNTLAHYSGSVHFLLNGILDNAFVFELVGLPLYGRLDFGFVAVVEFSLLDPADVVVMLFGEDLPVLNGLYRVVVVVLVVFLYLGGMDLLFVLRFDRLVLHRRSRLW